MMRLDWRRRQPSPQPFGNLFYLAPPHAYYRPATVDELADALMHERGIVHIEVNGTMRSFYIEDWPVGD